ELQRCREDARVRFHEPVFRRRYRGGNEALQREMRLKRREAPMRVRNETDADAGCFQLAERRRNILVELEVVARRPLCINLARALLDARALTSHLLDDVP